MYLQLTKGGHCIGMWEINSFFAYTDRISITLPLKDSRDPHRTDSQPSKTSSPIVHPDAKRDLWFYAYSATLHKGFYISLDQAEQIRFEIYHEMDAYDGSSHQIIHLQQFQCAFQPRDWSNLVIKNENRPMCFENQLREGSDLLFMLTNPSR